MRLIIEQDAQKGAIWAARYIVSRIKAKAEDLAGNAAEAELTFSVNRFGSAYDGWHSYRHLPGTHQNAQGR